MGEVRNLQIIFEHEGGRNVNVFSQGDVINGRVVIQVETEDQQVLKHVQGIWVRFKGKAKTKWTTMGGTSTSPPTRTYTLKECYFDKTILLLGTGKYQPSIRNLNLPPGTHSFPFMFQLPRDQPLPSPFEGKYGYVRYKAKATISLIRIISNKEFKTERLFSIFGPTVDLNLIPGMELPVNGREQQLNCCGCGSTVEAEIVVGLPKQGYVPGERIYFIGHVDNRDSEEQRDFQAKLVQMITFYSEDNVEIKDYTLAIASSTVWCPRGRVTDFTVGPLLIPPVPSSRLPGCNVIDINYHVECKDSSFKKVFEIIIGTVPLRIRAPAMPTTVATAPPPTHTQTQLAPAYSGEAPPPSYEAAVGVIDRLTNDRNTEDYFSEGQFVHQLSIFQPYD